MNIPDEQDEQEDGTTGLFWTLSAAAMVFAGVAVMWGLWFLATNTKL